MVLNQLKEIVGGRNASAFSLSGTPGTGTHDSRSAGHVQLSGIGKRPQPREPDSYAAYAAPNLQAQSHDQKSDGVLRTTEVRISTVSGRDVEDIESDSDGRIGFALTTRGRGRHVSPTESEEELADAGGIFR